METDGEGVLLKAPWFPFQQGAPVPVAGEHVGRGKKMTAFLNPPACLTLPDKQMPGHFPSLGPQ